MLRLRGHGVSETGRVREHNEDAGFLGSTLALVADGVGGAAAGEVASATAAYVVSTLVCARPDAPPAALLGDALDAARGHLLRGASVQPTWAEMATTLTALATDGERVALAHVGDSRAYRFRDGELVRLSRDHSWVQGRLDAGQMEPGAARRHPWRSVVLRSLHARSGPAAEVDVLDVDVRPGDRVLLCTDGLSDLVRDERIAEVLWVPDTRAVATGLVRDALYAGGTDNVTVLVADVVDGPRPVGDGIALGSLTDLDHVVDAAGIHAG